MDTLPARPTGFVLPPARTAGPQIPATRDAADTATFGAAAPGSALPEPDTEAGDRGRRTRHDGVALVAVAPAHRRAALTLELADRGFGTVLQASTPAEVLRLTGTRDAGDLALVDAGLGEGTDGADPGGEPVAALISALRTAGWGHVVVLSDDVRVRTVARTLGSAQGFLVRTAPSATPGRRSTLPHDVDERRRHVPDDGGRERVLSLREVEVLELAANGMGNSEIAHSLGLSTLTVKSHLARISRRLGARDRAHVVLLALRAGVIT